MGVPAALLMTIATFIPDEGDRTLEAVLAIGILLTLLAHVYLLAGGRRALRVARALAARGWQTFLSYRFQVIMVFVQLAILVAVVVLLGEPLVRALFEPVGLAMANYTQTNYVVFLLLGISTWPILWGAYEVSAGRMRQEQMTGLFEALVPTAAGVETLPFAYLLSRVATSLVALAGSLTVFAFVLPEGALRVAGAVPLLAFAAVVFLSMVTMWGLGLIITGLTTLYKQAGAASSILRFILIAFAGIYVPVELLPAWAEPVSKALPLTYAFDAVRALLGRGASVADVMPELAILSLFALYASVGGMLVFRYLLDRARKAGTLYGY